jgi:cytochrome c-type biogenesis protein CcmH/NrfG
VYLKLGNIHYRRGALDTAHVAWEQALVLDPDNHIVKANLAALPRTTIALETDTENSTEVGDVFEVAVTAETAGTVETVETAETAEGDDAMAAFGLDP